jgi:hypothetical protein
VRGAFYSSEAQYLLTGHGNKTENKEEKKERKVQE